MYGKKTGGSALLLALMLFAGSLSAQTVGTPAPFITDTSAGGVASVIWPNGVSARRSIVTICAQVQVNGVTQTRACKTKTGAWVLTTPPAPPPVPPPAPPPPPPAPVVPPVAIATADCDGFICTLDGSASTNAIKWEWRYNGYPVEYTGEIYVYKAPNTNVITRTRILRVTGATGLTAEDTVSFTTEAVIPTPPPDTVIPPSPGQLRFPEPPRDSVDTTYPTLTGSTINVASGGNLQTAINSAACGDEIVLAAGATFTGNFILPDKGCSSYIVIRTGGTLPAVGTRVTPTTAATHNYPKILAPGGNLSPIETAQSAGYYRLVGLEVTALSGVTSLNAMVRIHAATMTQLSHVPHHIVLDRMYIHGHSTMTLTRCVMGNALYMAVINSWLTDCHSNGGDSQAFAAWHSPGPFRLENNYLAGAGENVIFGGADVTIAGLIPSDIIIRRNHFQKPPGWQSLWTSKNLLEFKSAQRVIVEGNVFENNWVGGQSGHGHNWKSTVQNPPDTAVTKDVNFQYNFTWKSACGIKISADPVTASAGRTERIRIAHNAFANIGDSTYTGCGALFQPQYDVVDLVIEYNTGWAPNSLLTLYGLPAMERFIFRGNIGQPGAFGVKGGGVSEGIASLNTYAPGWVFTGNVIIGGVASRYPLGNFFPTTRTTAGLVTTDGKFWTLTSSSPYLTSGPNGTRPGVDMNTLQAKIAGVVVSP